MLRVIGNVVWGCVLLVMLCDVVCDWECCVMLCDVVWCCVWLGMLCDWECCVMLCVIGNVVWCCVMLCVIGNVVWCCVWLGMLCYQWQSHITSNRYKIKSSLTSQRRCVSLFLLCVIGNNALPITTTHKFASVKDQIEPHIISVLCDVVCDLGMLRYQWQLHTSLHR